MKTTLEDMHLIVASLTIVVLGLQAVPECEAQSDSPYIPPPSSVAISLQTNGGTVSVTVGVDYGSTCLSVGDWGQPQRVGNIVFVDAQFWLWSGVCLPVMMYYSTQYNLGMLAPGNYNFVFQAWGTTVKTQAFSVPEPEPPRLSIRVSQVELCWETAINSWYQLQYRSTLTTNQWLPLTLWLPGSGYQFCTNDAILAGQAQRFYQVARTNAPPP